MRQATAFWSLKPAACLPHGGRNGAGDAAGLPHGFADCLPHVASVFNEDMRLTLTKCTSGTWSARWPQIPTPRQLTLLGVPSLFCPQLPT